MKCVHHSVLVLGVLSYHGTGTGEGNVSSAFGDRSSRFDYPRPGGTAFLFRALFYRCLRQGKGNERNDHPQISHEPD